MFYVRATDRSLRIPLRDDDRVEDSIATFGLRGTGGVFVDPVRDRFSIDSVNLGQLAAVYAHGSNVGMGTNEKMSHATNIPRSRVTLWSRAGKDPIVYMHHRAVLIASANRSLKLCSHSSSISGRDAVS